MGNIIYSIIWLIILIFLAFWIAGISAGFYVILLPFTVCIEPLSHHSVFRKQQGRQRELRVVSDTPFPIFRRTFEALRVVAKLNAAICLDTGLTDFLLTVIQFPKYCAQAMMDGRGFR